jgi:catechol 2,3-dioxygenase-like lactoylglutathione lyase family enzyme
MPKLNGIKETCLTVADVDRSERFYREVFDLPVIGGDEHRFRALDVAGSHVLLLFLHGSSEQPIELPGGTIPPHGASGRSHFAFAISADELKAWKARLAKHGVAIEGTVTWPLGGTSIYFRDPDGHLGELVTPGVWSTY